MYKVMIVDDEKFIRKSIRNRINWEKFGLSVEAEAGNGEEALQMLEEVRPEVILVDIRMPVMDGLEFIAESQKRLPKSCYVIMSAYSDFSYAKKAIQLGVEEYILKPVEEEELEKILNKIIHSLNQAHLMRQVSHAENQDRELPLNSDRLAALAFWIVSEEELTSELEQVLKDNGYITGNDVEVYCLEDYSRENCYVYLLNGKKLTEEGIKAMLESIAHHMPQEAVVAFSEVESGKSAREAAAKSVRTLKRKLFQPEKKVLRENSGSNVYALDKQKAIRERMSLVYRFLLNKEYERAIQEFASVIDQVIRKENSVAIIEETVSECLMMLKHFPGEKNDSTDFNIMIHKFKSLDYLLEYKRAVELKNDLKVILDQFAGSGGKYNKRDVISSIKTYIQENYSSDLNATLIANKFFLNKGYLSTLFKEKTGIKLVTYIEGIRMERAKGFLENNVWTVTEVAIETGYSDVNYFSKVFKKYTGMSPRQYRESALEMEES